MTLKEKWNLALDAILFSELVSIVFLLGAVYGDLKGVR